jgi:cysteinyl-tRNA synthetase
MSDKYDVSLREAMLILGKKAATVRSYIRSGRLTKEYVEGFNGQEIRLSRTELEALKKSLKDTPAHTGERVSDTVKEKSVKDTPSSTVTNTVITDSNVAHAIEVLEKELEELRKEKEAMRLETKDINEKNFQMAGQLGYFQNQVETLKDQVKQLSAPEEKSSRKKQPSFWDMFRSK